MTTHGYLKNSGPVARNHGDLYNKLLAMVQGRYGLIHAEVNSTGVGVGEGNWTASGEG